MILIVFRIVLIFTRIYGFSIAADEPVQSVN